jgi:hypothetical protein
MTLKPIPDTSTLPVVCEFEWFTVKEYDPWTLWIENGSGEGKTFQRAEFLASLGKIWGEGV